MSKINWDDYFELKDITLDRYNIRDTYNDKETLLIDLLNEVYILEQSDKYLNLWLDFDLIKETHQAGTLDSIHFKVFYMESKDIDTYIYKLQEYKVYLKRQLDDCVLYVSSLINNKETALELVKENVNNLFKLNFKLQSDRDIVKAALETDTRIISKIQSKFYKDIRLMSDVVYKEHFCLVFANNTIQQKVRINVYQRRLKDTTKNKVVTELIKPN